ncbi:MAG TPA: metallopeptidase family protein [Candidatus Saccharimonadales bacterium]|nr:metallopeptidase family protein [Candidatus Saccharimonadales bacterium]
MNNIPIPEDKEFEEMINNGISRLPKLYQENLDNVGFVIADEPTPDQREELKLRCHETLFGLYQGIPLTKRGSGYNLVLPDKITIFKLPIVAASRNIADIAEHVRHTVWHEIAHYYGLNHDKIHKLEK